MHKRQGGVTGFPGNVCRAAQPWPQRPALVWHRLTASRVGPTASGGGQADCGDLARVEAVLFLAQDPLTSRKLAQLAGLADGTKARTLVRTLNRQYAAVGSAFRAEEVAGGFQLLTRPRLAPWLRRAFTASPEIRLSAPSLETLAVIAYRQPVLRAEIEAIRGVQCDEVLRQLIERGLAKVVGRSHELGRPLLYGTTRRFLQVFGLRHTDELPSTALPRSPLVPEQPPADNPLNQVHVTGFQDALEEDKVKTTWKQRRAADEIADRETELLVAMAPDDEVDDEEFDDGDEFDDDEDEDWEEEEEEESEELDEDTWEEVEDDDEEEEDDDEDWDEEDDEDWDEEDDEDWDEEEEDFEEQEE
ncbi:MAG: SMC-Scp complex subunit ScpB [Planctomycetota bacterium]